MYGWKEYWVGVSKNIMRHWDNTDDYLYFGHVFYINDTHVKRQARLLKSWTHKLFEIWLNIIPYNSNARFIPTFTSSATTRAAKISSNPSVFRMLTLDLFPKMQNSPWQLETSWTFFPLRVGWSCKLKNISSIKKIMQWTRILRHRY